MWMHLVMHECLALFSFFLLHYHCTKAKTRGRFVAAFVDYQRIVRRKHINRLHCFKCKTIRHGERGHRQRFEYFEQWRRNNHQTFSIWYDENFDWDSSNSTVILASGSDVGAIECGRIVSRLNKTLFDYQIGNRVIGRNEINLLY